MTLTPSPKPRRDSSRPAHQAPPAKLAARAAAPAHGELSPSRGDILQLLLSGRPAWRESPQAAPIALAARDAALLAWLAIE
jgi:hypothetical protein